MNKTPLFKAEPVKEIKKENIIDNWIKDQRTTLNGVLKVGDHFMLYYDEDHIMNRVFVVSAVNDSLKMKCVAAPNGFEEEIGTITTIKSNMLDFYDDVTYNCHLGG